MTEAIKSKTTKQLLMDRNFLSLFLGGLVSDIGTQFTFIAILFLGIRFNKGESDVVITQSLALMTVFFILPSVFLSPFAGAIADRFKRKKLMVNAELFNALVTLSLIGMMYYYPKMAGIYTFAFLFSIGRTIFYPARGGAFPKIVDKKDLVRANSIISTFTQLSRIAGPALAGLIVGYFGLEIAFIIDMISYFISAVLIATININLDPENRSEDPIKLKRIVMDIGDGVKYIKSDRIIGFIIFVLFFGLFFIGLTDPIIAPYTILEFGFTETTLGWYFSIGSITGILTAMFIAKKGDIDNKITVTIASLYVLAVPYILYGLAAYLYDYHMPLLILATMIGGGFLVLVNVPASALIQTLVPNEHLGKVSGAMNTLFSLAQVIAVLFVSVLAGIFLIQQIFLIGATVMIVITTLGMLSIKKWRLEEEYQQRLVQLDEEAKAEEEKKGGELKTIPIAAD